MFISSENFKVAAYIRLSREDDDKNKMESESIGNQRAIIMRYLADKNLELVDEYVDDGVSGTTFDRPEFQRMIRDVFDGRINMVITKDLSRFGRDYIKGGDYLEKIFPEYGVRYVAINDGIDTFENENWMEMTPIKSVFNDYYPKDISRKVKSVFKEKQKKGEYLCSQAPYGYKKDTLLKNHLVIDEEVVHNVRKIFEMYLGGKSIYEIREVLNSKGIQSPSGYAKKQADLKPWNSVTLLNILKNEAYIGNTVGNKKIKVSLKSKKRLIVPKENQIKIENTHEPIISKTDFEEVQFLLSQKSINRKQKHEYLFRGLIKCKTCHGNLEVGAKQSKKGKKIKNPIPYITCRNSKKKVCPSQHLNYNKFEKEILEYLRNFLNVYNDKKILKDIYQMYLDGKDTDGLSYKKELENIDKRINQINSNLDMIYSDRLNGTITEEQYKRFQDTKLAEKQNLEQRKEEIDELIKKSKKKNNTTKSEMDKVINEFLSLEKPDKKVLFKLIDCIEIDENKNVYIKFAFKELENLNKMVVSNKGK